MPRVLLDYKNRMHERCTCGYDAGTEQCYETKPQSCFPNVRKNLYRDYQEDAVGYDVRYFYTPGAHMSGQSLGGIQRANLPMR